MPIECHDQAVPAKSMSIGISGRTDPIPWIRNLDSILELLAADRWLCSKTKAGLSRSKLFPVTRAIYFKRKLLIMLHLTR